MSKEVNKKQQTIFLIILLIGGLGYAFYYYLLVPKWKSIADLKAKVIKVEAEVRGKRAIVSRSKEINSAFGEVYAQAQRLKNTSFAPKIDIVVWLANYTKKMSAPYGLDSRSFHYRQVGVTGLISGTLNVGKSALQDFQIEVDTECSLNTCYKILVDCEKNPMLSVISMDLSSRKTKAVISFRFVIPRLNGYGYSMLSKIEKFVAKKELSIMKENELDRRIKKTKHLLFHERGYLAYPAENSRNIFKVVMDPEAYKLALSEHQAKLIKKELESYKVSSVINGASPMFKFTNGSKWYKQGDVFYVGDQKLPVTFSKVLSNPTRILLISGSVKIIKNINKK